MRGVGDEEISWKILVQLQLRRGDVGCPHAQTDHGHVKLSAATNKVSGMAKPP